MALANRLHCRLHGRVASASVVDTASAASSKDGAGSSVDERVRKSRAPLRMLLCDNVVDKSKGDVPGQDNW